MIDDEEEMKDYGLIEIDGCNVEECFCPFDEDLAREIFKKLDDRIKRLKAENEHLKEKLKKNNIIHETVVMNVDKCFMCLKKRNYEDNWQNCRLKCSYKYAKRKNDESIKYQQALEEIRDIAEKEFEKKFKDKDCFDCDFSFECILNKINEVLADD